MDRCDRCSKQTTIKYIYEPYSKIWVSLCSDCHVEFLELKDYVNKLEEKIDQIKERFWQCK